MFQNDWFRSTRESPVRPIGEIRMKQTHVHNVRPLHVALIAGAGLASLLLNGCAIHDPAKAFGLAPIRIVPYQSAIQPREQPCIFTDPCCYGYHATSWRAWSPGCDPLRDKREPCYCQPTEDLPDPDMIVPLPAPDRKTKEAEAKDAKDKNATNKEKESSKDKTEKSKSSDSEKSKRADDDEDLPSVDDDDGPIESIPPAEMEGRYESLRSPSDRVSQKPARMAPKPVVQKQPRPATSLKSRRGEGEIVEISAIQSDSIAPMESEPMPKSAPQSTLRHDPHPAQIVDDEETVEVAERGERRMDDVAEEIAEEEDVADVVQDDESEKETTQAPLPNQPSLATSASPQPTIRRVGERLSTLKAPALKMVATATISDSSESDDEEVAEGEWNDESLEEVVSTSQTDSASDKLASVPSNHALTPEDTISDENDQAEIAYDDDELSSDEHEEEVEAPSVQWKPIRPTASRASISDEDEEDLDDEESADELDE